MSSSPQTQGGGASRCGLIIGPALDKIIKNVAWRKHTQLVTACKSVLDKLDSLSETPDPSSSNPLYGFSPSDAEFLLHPLVMALDSASVKVADPALDCAFRLFSSGLIRCEIDRPPDGNDRPSLIFQLMESVCKCGGLGDEGIELAVLKVLLAAVRSPFILVRGDCLVNIVRTCYNAYLGGLSGTNQICAKSVLAQMMIIVFTRVEEGSMAVKFRTVSAAELLEFTDRSLNEGNSIHVAQKFIIEVVEDSKQSIELQNGLKADKKSESIDGESKMEGAGSKIKEDGFMLFKNLCKLSMKFSSQKYKDDQILLRGKTLSLELLKVIMDNGGPVWRTNERFLNAIKKYLCLSLLKNSGLSAMTIFQLLCSIFENLLCKFRSGLKGEIGVFFPMLILRVLENVLQPSFLQKMTVLHLLERISRDSQIVIDIFVNYDCDVESPKFFERTVNGLLKTALGPPPGSSTTLSPVQDLSLRLESVKCLVRIIQSMGAWMDQQLKTGDFFVSDNENLTGSHTIPNGDEVLPDFELPTEATSESTDAASLEECQAYILQLQKGVSLFNKKPSKGIDFLMSSKTISDTPEAVAAFFKSTSGLNGSMIGEYLGENEEFPLKVMHAYVDSFNFAQLDFVEAIRVFLRGFRFPGYGQKIDRIMEKFAERYFKCNPNSFTSADTAYVLSYSVIMLNTDAHNSMVKDKSDFSFVSDVNFATEFGTKMTKADFIRNNGGIDDGKDLPEEYLGSLYDQIVTNKIKMKADTSESQSKQWNSINKLLGLDVILNLVWKQTHAQRLGSNKDLIKHIQEQFKSKSGKSESVYCAVEDSGILRFMIDVCWGPMLAAFSVTLDQSIDKAATSQCLQGFRHAVHVTAVTSMQTQRDAFVTSVAKFTYLHCAADMKQKNVDAVKTIISIAVEDGNYLEEAWEHILTCLSRFEHLQLLGDGDASSLTETEDKTLKTTGFTSLKKKGTLQNPSVMAVVRGGSYDSTTPGVNTLGLVKQEQISNFISNLNLLDQIGNFELNHIFAHTQSLNSVAIVAFVKALCKVSMSELQSTTDPRVFSLTKLVEVAHYNMNRIRLVWSHVWIVLSEFFVSAGLSENLSVAIFVMDSLRQLAMKFLEREELTNYNFQNEFLRPFVVVMQRSSSAEIRELIVRCISQMVLSRVNNLKSGWKSMFMVFTAAAADERKNIVLLAFETMEKIIRDYFTYINETESVSFSNCMNCLITFTNSRFNNDVSLSAISFTRFCAIKLADEGLVCNDKSEVNNCASNGQTFTDKETHISFWMPLLTGLSRLTSDARSAIRKSALEALFNILKDHGHLFSSSFWTRIFNSVILPIFLYPSVNKESQPNDDQPPPASTSPHPDGRTWDPETSTLATQCLVDLFVIFYNVLRSHLPKVVMLFAWFMKSHGQGSANIGVAALMRLAGDLGSKLSSDEWADIYCALKEVAASTVPGFLKLVGTMDGIEIPDAAQSYNDSETLSANGFTNDDSEEDNMHTAKHIVSRLKSHIASQLLIIQVITDLYKMHPKSLSPSNVTILVEIFSSIASHAHQLNSEPTLQPKLHRACSILDISEPPLVHFENESYQNHLTFLHDLLTTHPSLSEQTNIEPQLVSVSKNVLKIYLDCAGSDSVQGPEIHWILPLGSAKEELAARTSLAVSALRVLSCLERRRLKRYFSDLFPLLIDLVRSEHSSGEVQTSLRNMFESCIGPILMEL